VSSGLGLQFRTREAVCRHSELARVSLSRAAAGPCAREAPGHGPGFSTVGLAGAAGVLDAGDRAPIIGAAGEGSRGGGCWLCGCGSPMAGCGRAGPRACIHRFPDPRHACRGGAWAVTRLAGRGQSRGRPRCRVGGGRYPAGAVRCAASRPAACPVLVMRPVRAGRLGAGRASSCGGLVSGPDGCDPPGRGLVWLPPAGRALLLGVRAGRSTR